VILLIVLFVVLIRAMAEPTKVTPGMAVQIRIEGRVLDARVEGVKDGRDVMAVALGYADGIVEVVAATPTD